MELMKKKKKIIMSCTGVKLSSRLVTLDNLKWKRGGSTQMKEKIHPKGCIQDEEKVRFWTLLDGGIFISQWLEGKWIGWIFLSNSLVHWAKDITNLWRFGQKKIPSSSLIKEKNCHEKGFMWGSPSLLLLALFRKMT